MTNLFLIPGYRYCGPGNELKGQDPRNALDNYCRIHDVAYGKHKKTPYLEYVNADRDLDRTIQREYTQANMKGNLRGTKGGKYSTGETLTAKFVQGVFKAKEYLAPHNLSMPRTTPRKRSTQRIDFSGQIPASPFKSQRIDSYAAVNRDIQEAILNGPQSSMSESEGQMHSTNTYSQCSAAARGSGAPLGVATDVALRTKPTIRWGKEEYSVATSGKPNSNAKSYSVREPFRFNMKSEQAKRELMFFSVRHSAVSKPALYDPTDPVDYPDLFGYKTLLPGYNTTTAAPLAEKRPIKTCAFNAGTIRYSSNRWDTLSQLNICDLENASYNLMTNRKITSAPVTKDMSAFSPEEVYKTDYSRTYPYVSMNTRNYNSSAPQFINTDNKQFGAGLPCPSEDKIITNLGRGSVKFSIYNSSDTPAVVTIIKYRTGAVKTPVLLNGMNLTTDSPGPGRNIANQLLARKELSMENHASNVTFGSSGRDDLATDIFNRPKSRALPENVKFKNNTAVIPYVAANDVPAHNGLIAVVTERLDSVPFKEVDRIALTIPAGQRQTTDCQLPPLSYDSAKDFNRTPYVAALNVGTSTGSGVSPLASIDPDFQPPPDPAPPNPEDISNEDGNMLIDDSTNPYNPPISSPNIAAPTNASSAMGGGWSSEHCYTFAILVNGMPLMSEAGSGVGNIGTGHIVDIQEAPTEIYVEGVYTETCLPSVSRHSSQRMSSLDAGLYDIPGVSPVRIIPMSEAVRTSATSHLPFTGGVV